MSIHDQARSKEWYERWEERHGQDHYDFDNEPEEEKDE